jgi:transcriptional regulator with XRE-family HTH domain
MSTPEHESDNDNAAGRGEYRAAMPVSNRIAEWRKVRGLTQEGLAELVGVSKSLVSLWETGDRRVKMDQAVTIAHALGIQIGQLFLNRGAEISVENVATPKYPPTGVTQTSKDLPVRGYAQGGNRLVMIDHEAARERIERPPYLEGVDEAFAVYMVGSSMFPALRPGWPLYIHPGQPPRAGDYVLVEMADGDALVKELIKESPEKVILREYGPVQHDFEVSKNEIKKLYRVRGAEF